MFLLFASWASYNLVILAIYFFDLAITISESQVTVLAVTYVLTHLGTPFYMALHGSTLLLLAPQLASLPCDGLVH